MLKATRQEAIIRLLKERGTISIHEAAEAFSVSVMTVRRDFDELARQGRIIRLHGGATLPPPQYTEEAIPSFYEQTARTNAPQKGSIGRRAAQLIHEGESIFLAGGTTVDAIARALPPVHLSVLTNSISVFRILQENPEVDLYVLGGIYRRNVFSILGTMTASNLRTMHVDKAFIGADGIMDGSVYTSHVECGKFQKVALNHARERYVAADASKVGRRDFYDFYRLHDLTAVITSADIPREHLADLSRRTEVII